MIYSIILIDIFFVLTHKVNTRGYTEKSLKQIFFSFSFMNSDELMENICCNYEFISRIYCQFLWINKWNFPTWDVNKIRTSVRIVRLRLIILYQIQTFHQGREPALLFIYKTSEFVRLWADIPYFFYFFMISSTWKGEGGIKLLVNFFREVFLLSFKGKSEKSPMEVYASQLFVF